MGGIGEPRADREEVALNPFEHRLHVGIHTRGADAAEPRAELVHVAVGVDARIRLDTRVPSNSPVSPLSPVLV